jgi:hypothetical protein
MDVFSIEDMTIYLNDPVAPSKSIILPEVQDSNSKIEGNQDGVTNCGARVYEIVNP